MIKRILFLLVAAALALSACGGGEAAATSDPNAVMTLAFATVNASFTQTALAVPTNTPLPTETATLPAPTSSGSEQLTPTVTFPVTITVQANCRFGPDTAYAGPGGLRSGKVLEAIGRDPSAQWFLLREAGGKKACWVNIIALDLTGGDPNALAIAPVSLVFTPDYLPPANVAATRNVDQVTITWADVPLQPKDTHPESHYFLELWLCNNGALTFTVRSTNDLTITIIDQPGCAEASHGQIYTATRSGYSQPAPIPWP
jgi:hypothetical protein